MSLNAEPGCIKVVDTFRASPILARRGRMAERADPRFGPVSGRPSDGTSIERTVPVGPRTFDAGDCVSTLRFPFADAKAWLVESVRRRLPGDLCHSAATLVDLHLDPANFAMPLDVRDPQLHEALRFGETLANLRQYVTFEDTTTIAGVCRVMVRTH